ncbi:imidazoleglycerol-phosphate dehydratase HisB [Tepidibacillus fermentans]|uniref:Imidazoleglycerol-phosphate dehydratase n=1 Tax=Tepidibacillus fermentans TaxID=1281767 RepID=A0A4V2USK7_9BACI|nr:imidazoleglycerol-phosphate dehydratase HisB [Tepidibacillus fermentans]TCS81802.1 imidazoleglycerol-phosphate dehydratase [Tepidibacillus fermentans]
MERERKARIYRKTKETEIEVVLNLDGEGKTELETGVPFLEHMLDLWSKHGHFDLTVKAKGDIEIDDHHTVEDIAICLGQAFKEALGSKEGINRYGMSVVPMDEALGQVIVDISNRPHLEYRIDLPDSRIGTFATELFHEFLWKFALESRMTIHTIVHYGRNSHHMIEAIFKALGRSLHEAIQINPKQKGIPSSKGVL